MEGISWEIRFFIIYNYISRLKKIKLTGKFKTIEKNREINGLYVIGTSDLGYNYYL